MSKRMGYIVFVLALVLGLGMVAGCGDDADEEETEGTETTEGVMEDETEDTDGVTEGDMSGEEVFANNCAGCHGAEGEGGSGPALADSGLDADQVEEVVRNGGGDMPAFEGQLSDEEIQAVSAHVADELAE